MLDFLIQFSEAHPELCGGILIVAGLLFALFVICYFGYYIIRFIVAFTVRGAFSAVCVFAFLMVVILFFL